MAHFHNTFFGDNKSKFGGRLNENKLLCHMIVWALYLTPKLSVDLKPMYEELQLEFQEMRKFARYVGCNIDMKMHNQAVTGQVGIQVLQATLKAPLRMADDMGGKKLMKKRKKA